MNLDPFTSRNIVKAEMSEYFKIEKEIQYHNKVLRTLRARYKLLENNIINYLDASNLKGVRYQDMIFEKKEGVKRVAKKKEEKIECFKDTLYKHGIESHQIAEELLQSLKGETEERNFLRVKKR